MPKARCSQAAHGGRATISGHTGKQAWQAQQLECLCHLELAARLPPELRHQVMRGMFGGHPDDCGCHRDGIDEGLLMAWIGQAGSGSGQRVGSFGGCRVSGVLEFPGLPVSLNVTAVWQGSACDYGKIGPAHPAWMAADSATGTTAPDASEWRECPPAGISSTLINP